jgi:hypothetical protein
MIYRDAFRVRPSPKPPEILESEWNTRFYVGKLQDYQVEKTLKGAKTDRSNARLRPILSPITSPRSSRRASRLPLSPRVISRASALWERRGTLKTDVNSALPSQLPAKQDSEGLLSTQERVLITVNEREKLLETLRNLGEMRGNEQEIKQNVRETLITIQRISVKLTAEVEKLQKERGIQGDFDWKGVNYLSKMKGDLEDMQRLAVGRYMPDVTDDPMLIRSLGDVFTRLRTDSNTHPNVAQLIQAESFILHASFRAKIPLSPSLEDTNPLPSGLTYYSPSSHIDLLSSTLLSTLISDFTASLCPAICSEACIEWERAHLSLYSSRILNVIVSQVLLTEIPACAHEAYIEEVDREFFALQREIIEKTVIRELMISVEPWVLEVAAEDIAWDMGNTVDIAELVREAIKEEQEDNKSLMESMFSQIINEYLREEWLEILCEDEYSEALIESRLKDLPLRLLSPSHIQSKAIELIYREIVDSYVAGIWLDLLVRSLITPVAIMDQMPLSPLYKRGFKTKK